MVSLNEFMEAGANVPNSPTVSSHFMQAEDVMEERELKEKLAESLEALNEKEKLVIQMYYYDEMTLKEIAAVLEVSESRVSQIHTKALNKMRDKLGRYLGILLK